MQGGGNISYILCKDSNPRQSAQSYTSQGAPDEPSTASSWDVGNPKPTNSTSSNEPKEHDDDDKALHNKEVRASSESPEGHHSELRPVDPPTPSLEKETSAREFFHGKAKETEDRLHDEEEKSKRP